MSSLIKISLWLSLSELAFNFSGYIIHALLGRTLGPADYGRFSLVIVFATMIVILIGRGVPIAMNKYLSEIKIDQKNPESKTRFFEIKQASMILQLVIIATFTSVYFFASPYIAILLKDESLTPLFQLSSLIIPAFGLASFYVYYYTGIQHFNKQAFLKFFRASAKILLIVGLACLFNVKGAIIGQATAPFLVFLIAIFMDPFKMFKEKQIKVSSNKKTYKKLFDFAWVIIFFLIFYELMISIDLYLVKAILQDDALTGVYNAALTVGRIPYYAFYFLTIILLPKTSQLITEGSKDKIQKLLQSSFKFLFMFIFPVVTITALFADPAIRFFYGNQYRLGAPSLEILIFGFGFLTVFYVLTFVLNGAGKNKIPLFISILGATLNAILNYIFIQKYGLIGSAIATTITSFIVMIIALIYTNKTITRFIQPISLLKYFVASIAIYLIGQLDFFTQGKYIFILWSFILLVIYLLILFLLGEIKKDDLQFIIKAFRKNKIINES